MKKIIILALTVVSFASCAVVTTNNTYADITLYDMTGGTLDHWDNALLNSETVAPGTAYTSMPIKTGGGLAFTDEDGVQRYISGGIIVADNIRSSLASANPSASVRKAEKTQDAEKMIAEYNSMKKEVEDAEKQLKQCSKGSKEYEEQKEQVKEMKKRLGEVASVLYNKYHYNVATKTFM